MRIHVRKPQKTSNVTPAPAEIAATRAAAARVSELLDGPRDGLTATAIRDAMRPARREHAIRKMAERDAANAAMDALAEAIGRSACGASSPAFHRDPSRARGER